MSRVTEEAETRPGSQHHSANPHTHLHPRKPCCLLPWPPRVLLSSSSPSATEQLHQSHPRNSPGVLSTGVMWSCLGQQARGSGGQGNLDSDICGFCTGPSFLVQLTVDQKECRSNCDRLTSMRTEPYWAHCLIKLSRTVLVGSC